MCSKMMGLTDSGRPNKLLKPTGRLPRFYRGDRGETVAVVGVSKAKSLHSLALTVGLPSNQVEMPIANDYD
jgi:hypothetical protein